MTRKVSRSTKGMIGIEAAIILIAFVNGARLVFQPDSPDL